VSSPRKIGTQNCFRRLWDLVTNIRTKYNIYDGGTALEITKSPLHWSKNGKRYDLCFYPSSVNVAFCFFASLCRGHLTQINQTLRDAGGKLCLQTFCKIGNPFPKKMVFFSTVSRINSKHFRKETSHRQWENGC